MTESALRVRIGQWFQRSPNRRILAAILTVGGFSVVVKVAAMAKELVVAYRFGTSDAIDAFFIALLLPTLVVNVVTGSFSAAFTPAYVKVRESRGKSEALALLQSGLWGGAVLVVGVMCVLLLALPLLPVLAAGFSPEKLALTRALFLILLPIILLNAFIALWSAALNCEGRFAWAALAPVGVPLVTLAAVSLGARVPGGYALALGTVLGYATQCGILAIALARAQIPLRPRWGGGTPELTSALRQYLPMTAGALLMSSSWVIGQAMAATLPSGSVAALNYGNKIPAVVGEVGTMAIATAILPHFSEMVARRNWPGIRHTLRVYSRLIALAVIPGCLLAIYFSTTIVHLLFERGAFSATDTKTVATVQGLYLLQVPLVMGAVLFVRLASSLRRNQILLFGAGVTLPLNIVLNAVFMRWLGVAGIPLSTSVVSLVSCLYLFIAVGRALKSVERQYPDSVPA